MIKQLIDMPFLKFQKIEYSDSLIRIKASIKSCRSRCPSCGKYSKRVHDYYYRTIADFPVFQNRTVIRLKTRKFKCVNNRCHRKVFSEHTPDIVRYSRRTSRATRIMETFAILNSINTKLESITPIVLINFINSLPSDTQVTNSIVFRYMKQFMKWLHENGVLKEDVSKFLKHSFKCQSKGRPDYLSTQFITQNKLLTLIRCFTINCNFSCRNCL